MNRIRFHMALSVLCLFIAFLVGAYVRLDQFLLQILIDDEWHAVHQLLRSTPAKIATSFGHADYSIPLTLLYWMEARQFGLSELLMRWPMMLSGIIALIVFPVYIYRRLTRWEAVFFGFLLALSPLLVIFSRTARPYAITLFLVYLSLWSFYRFFQLSNSDKSGKRLWYAAIYSISTAMAVWMHLIVAFFVISPFIVEGFRLFLQHGTVKKRNFAELLKVGLPAFALTSALILPPLVSSLNALTVKAGSHLPSLDTLIGAVYLWLGTKSDTLVICFSVLAVIGLPRLITKSIFAMNVLVGFVLTFILILITQPAWVNHPLTLARYLLPIVPLLLLAVASGLYVILKRLNSGFVYPAVSFVLVTGLIFTSPLDDLLRKPNSNTLHPFYSFEFRPEKNEIDRYLRKHLYSDFWKSFAKDQPATKTIAVAPWYFESHFWDGPVWEKISRQRIIPAYLIGLCVKNRAGEVPNSQRFRFRNVGYPGDPENIRYRGVNYIVYQKPDRLKITNLYTDISHCDSSLQTIYGQPVYEDQIIKVYQTDFQGSPTS